MQWFGGANIMEQLIAASQTTLPLEITILFSSEFVISKSTFKSFEVATVKELHVIGPGGNFF